MKLFKTLQKGKKRLGEEALSKVTGFVDSQRTEEESFINKSGKADLYYTSFAWLLSLVFGIKLNDDKMNVYLAEQDTENLDLVHYAAYMRCRMLRELGKKGKIGMLFNSLSSAEKKDSKSFDTFPHYDEHSPYTQYIRLSLLEDMEQTIDKSLGKSLSEYQLPCGGYTNIPDSASATTNATVAALAVMGQLNGYKRNTAIDYLRDSQDFSGGFAATENAPIPDLLSTATSLFMLNCYKVKPRYPTRDFIEAHWLDSGGFSATLFDDKSDVEYTFYGLLALGAT